MYEVICVRMRAGIRACVYESVYGHRRAFNGCDFSYF